MAIDRGPLGRRYGPYRFAVGEEHALIGHYLAGEDGQRMQKLLDALDDLDDVQAVYTTASIEE